MAILIYLDTSKHFCYFSYHLKMKTIETVALTSIKYLLKTSSDIEMG